MCVIPIVDFTIKLALKEPVNDSSHFAYALLHAYLYRTFNGKMLESCNPGIHPYGNGWTVNPKEPSGTADFVFPFPDHHVGANQKLPRYTVGFFLEHISLRWFVPDGTTCFVWRFFFPGINPWVTRLVVSDDTFRNVIIKEKRVSQSRFDLWVSKNKWPHDIAIFQRL